MPIRAKVDEDLPGETAELLRKAGHDAMTVVEQRLSGSSDEHLWNIAFGEQRWLFTADKGFSNKWATEAGGPSGIVLLRLPRESRQGYIRLVEVLLKQFNFDVPARHDRGGDAKRHSSTSS